MKELKLLSLVLVAGTATMFTACTSESDNSPSANISYESVAAAQQVPVAFSTYVGESAITRAGHTGAMDIFELQTNGTGKANGFGVYAYYTNNGDYDNDNATVSLRSQVNFMWNQRVYDSSGSWYYTPKKYWPNETTNDSEATGISTSTDKLTFFAYAPYVLANANGTLKNDGADPFDGQSHTESAAEVGITGISSNECYGDPSINYTVASDADNTVDLLWGVAGAANTTPIVNTSASPNNWNITAGMPFINLVKPKLASSTTSSPISFTFKHALAKLTFSVQGAFDEVAPGTNDVDGSTRIVIESVAVTTEFYKNGVLNLNNTAANTPNWGTKTGTLSFTIGDDIVAGLKYSGTDTYASQPTGVTNTKQYLMDAAGATKFFGLIPDNDKDINITITYHVYTVDSNLHDGWSKITNVITKKIDDFDAAAGNWYNINMILGMESVAFEASVTPWSGENESTVDLPINVVAP